MSWEMKVSFDVHELRETFSFPDQPGSRRVVIWLSDASSRASAQIKDFKSLPGLLGDDITMTATLQDGYFITGADPRVIHAPPWYDGGFIVAATDFHNTPILIKDAENEVTLGFYRSIENSWYYLDGEKIEGAAPQWTPIPV